MRPPAGGRGRGGAPPGRPGNPRLRVLPTGAPVRAVPHPLSSVAGLVEGGHTLAAVAGNRDGGAARRGRVRESGPEGVRP